MNPEMLMTYQISLGGIGLIAYCFLWSFGGRDGTSKAWRRWAGSFVMIAVVNALFIWRGAWSPWLLLMWPILGAASSMGYGGEKTSVKILRRSLFGAGVVLAGLVPAILIGGTAYGLLALQVFLASGTVWLGIKSVVPAAVEEFLVCLILSLTLIGYPFIV